MPESGATVVCGRICRTELAIRSTPGVLAGCHRRQHKSRSGPKSLSPRFVCGEKYGEAIVPASPDRAVSTGKADRGLSFPPASEGFTARLSIRNVIAGRLLLLRD